MAVPLEVSLNSIKYAVANRRSGARKGAPIFETTLVPATQDSVNVSGLPGLTNVPGVSTLVFPNFMDGFGRDRIDSDSAFDKAEYRRCYYATCDIRWARQQYLPILEANSTHSTLEVIRASESYKSNLWALWEDVSGAAVLARKYDGSEVDWIAGGRAGPVPFFDASTASTSDGFSHTVGTKGNRLLIVTVLAGTSPSGITYNGVAMTSHGDSAMGSERISTWYLVAPATGSNTITLAGEGSLTAIHATSYYGVNQSSPVGTLATSNGSSTAPTVNATGDNTSLIYGTVGANGTGTATVGAGQTERLTTANTERLATSTEPEVGTTTMSWTLASSVSWRTHAFAIKSSAVAGLDIHAHKTHLLALCAAADGHAVTRSTDGATFSLPSTQVTQGLLDNVVTAHEDIDAGLLATVGNEAVAVLWHESNGTITFFSSTNAGDVWTDEAIDIASGNGPQGVAVMNGIDNAQKLYVGTREGLYEVDTSPSTWTADLVFPMTPHNDNCRRMAVGQDGALWFAQGVDDDTVPIVYNMFTHNGTRQFLLSPNDFSNGDGLPTERLGPIRHMIPVQGMMYVAAGGGKAERKASIFVHNGRGWSSMRAHGTADQPIEWMAASGDDDGVPRLHYAVRTATAVSDAKFLKQAFVNPVTGVEPDRELSGFIDLPYLDAGFPGDAGGWLQVVINAEDLSPSNSNEFINVDFGEDDGSGGLNARSNTDLGDFLSGTNSIDFASGAGISSVNMGLRINFARDGSVATHTPKLKDVRIAVLKEVAIRDRFTFTIDVRATMALPGGTPGRTAENIITDWETARGLKTMATFTYGPVTTARYVKVRQAVWDMAITEGSSSQGAIAEKAQVQREGFIGVVLEEVV